QEPLLLEGTIAENLAYGCPTAPSESAMRKALATAQAEEFVRRLPQGLATRLGERGARLSGGEKQRLAIARALLRDPRVLILDEATAHLDAASEAALNLALRELVRDRTAIVISHRLATLIAADRILVVEGGRIREQGTPRELAGGGGFYARWATAGGEAPG
ncbi:MAG: ATP-binding cassette domain-containing protein, partial [Terriglobales bacterium]